MILIKQMTSQNWSETNWPIENILAVNEGRNRAGELGLVVKENDGYLIKWQSGETSEPRKSLQELKYYVFGYVAFYYIEIKP
jgi:hypothetical protein